MNKFVLLVILCAGVAFASRKVILKPGTHGFYRFFAWEAMAVLFVFKLPFWFIDSFSWHQILSWILLFGSAPVALFGLYEFMKNGKQTKDHIQTELYSFEKTSNIVESGIYRVIRHPMYASLVMLTWGIFLKKPDLVFVFVALFASLFLYLTARTDEKECVRNFGQPYLDYMANTKMFIPYLV